MTFSCMCVMYFACIHTPLPSLPPSTPPYPLPQAPSYLNIFLAMGVGDLVNLVLITRNEQLTMMKTSFLRQCINEVGF